MSPYDETHRALLAGPRSNSHMAILAGEAAEMAKPSAFERGARLVAQALSMAAFVTFVVVSVCLVVAR